MSIIKFRKESEETFYNNDDKKFLSVLPVSARKSFVFIIMFIVSCFSILFFIKVPDVIEGKGYIKSERYNAPILFNDNGYYINSILVKDGDFIKKDQDLIFLKKEINDKKNKIIISEINKYILTLKNTKKILNEFFKADLHRLEDLLEVQKEVLKLSKDSYKIQKNVVLNNKENLKNSLINYDTMITSELLLKEKESISEKENKELKSIYSNISNLIYIHKKSISDIDIEIHKEEVKIIEKSQNDIILKSPCDCVVEKIHVKKYDSSIKNKPLISINKNNKERYKIKIFIKSDEYQKVEENMEIKVQVTGYPFLKYGGIKAVTNYISSNTVNDDFLIKNKLDDSYYLIEGDITDINKKIKIKNNMNVDVKIVKGSNRLYKYIINKL